MEITSFENFEMQLNETAKGFLKEIAKWAYFLSIIGYIGIGFILLLAIFAGAIFSSLGNMNGGMNPIASLGGGTFITVLYLIIAGAYFFPVYYLNKFASNMKAAFRDNNTELLASSFGYLKSHYKFIGIFTLVIISIYALIFVFAIIAGAAAFAS